MRKFVSESLPSRSEAAEKLIATSGGSDDRILKNEYGAALTSPAASFETTHAIGRGKITDANSLYASDFDIVPGSKCENASSAVDAGTVAGAASDIPG